MHLSDIENSPSGLLGTLEAGKVDGWCDTSAGHSVPIIAARRLVRQLEAADWLSSIQETVLNLITITDLKPPQKDNTSVCV